jgi:hypothetical protein
LLQREQRLKEHLCNVREMASILEELLAWLSIAENTMDTLEAEPLPDDLPFVEILVKDHQDFMEDMAKRQPEMDRFCRTRTPDQENSQIPRILRSRSAFASKIINNSIHQLSFFFATSVTNHYPDSLLLGYNNQLENQGKVEFRLILCF